ncbi:carbohydrate-binding domain-containing protein [Enterococcus sp. LJL90]
MKKKYILGLTLSTVLIMLAACSTASGETSTSSSTTTSSTSSAEATTVATDSAAQNTDGTYGSYTDDDYDESYDESTATTITLNGDSAEIDGEGATESDGVITITTGGTYILSGEYDGEIIVSADADADEVQLVLNGVNITNDDSSAIYVEQAEKVKITLAKGTTNTVSDGSDYVYDSADEDEPDAAIFSKDDLTINGSGTLIVNGNYNNGIRGKDDVVITNGNIQVTAVNNAIKAKDSLSIAGGTFDLTTTSGDGIQVNGTDTDTGWIAIDGGDFTINSGNDGIQAETNLSISEATIEITAGGGADATVSDTTQSYKGLKVGANLIIDAGTFTIDSADDSIHSNNNVTINGGSLDLSSGDDGIHADNALLITDGQTTVNTSYEGLEGTTVTITGGTNEVRASDDGINAAGGSDDTTSSGGFGSDSFMGGGGGGDTTDEDALIDIQGGTTTVIVSEGDGIDSNGNVTMSGGTLIVDGPNSNDNGVLDYNGTFELSGGTLLAGGTSGMSQTVSSDSSQYSLAVVPDSTIAAGSTVIVSTDSGEVISYTFENQVNYLVTSSADMSSGTNVTLSADGSTVGTYSLTSVTTTSGTSSGNGMSGGRR